MAVKRSRRAGENSPPPRARPAQRRRTRKAIVDAATAILARGGAPSVDDVAREAEVSRRTVFLYFPTFDQLLIDATVGALSQQSIDGAIESGAADVDSRLEAMVRALHEVSPDVERLGRTLIRLTVDRDGTGEREPPRRGYRRVEWIESTLRPARERLGPERYARLAAALAMVVGWEALIVQRDVCGLGASQGVELSVWAARALLQASLQEARAEQRARPVHLKPARRKARTSSARRQRT